MIQLSGQITLWKGSSKETYAAHVVPSYKRNFLQVGSEITFNGQRAIVEKVELTSLAGKVAFLATLRVRNLKGKTNALVQNDLDNGTVERKRRLR